MQIICIFISFYLHIYPFLTIFAPSNSQLSTKTMTPEEEQIHIDSSRAALVASITAHISRDRLAEAQAIVKGATRIDAIENIVKDAVKRAGIVSFNGVPHIWVKRFGIYVKFDYNALKVAIYDSMRKCGVPNGCYSGVDRLVRLCWAESASNRKELDTSVVAFSNGVFDTMDMSLHESSPAYLTNMRVDYEYNPNDVPVGWKNFLDRVLPDEEMQDLLQEFVAATYVNRKCAKIEHMLMLIGSGANGKSVVFEVLTAMLGKDNVTNFSISDLIGQRRDQNVAVCNGKRLNYCSEIRTSEIACKTSDAFKALVSGESQMVRPLYTDPFCAENIPLLMANANAMPKIDDASYAIQRRILVIPFEVFIPEHEQDRELAEKLKSELPGIFNWAMKGLERLRENRYKIQVPERVREIVSEYVKDNNAVMRWLDDVGIIPRWNNDDNPQCEWSCNTELYAMWERWRLNNAEQPKTRNALYEALDLMGFRRKRRSAGCGYEYFRVPGAEEILRLNLDLALKIQMAETAEALRKQIEETDTMRVNSVEDVERYLGLPKDSIWAYMRNGALNTCFKRMPDGTQIYDIKAVQMELARSGFYTKLDRNGGKLKKVSLNALRGMRKAFNNQMKTMGIPIRKHGNVNGYIPLADRECWFVPDDWEYTKRAADLVMSREKDFELIGKRLEDRYQ